MSQYKFYRRLFSRKKFLGLVLSFDCDVPQALNKTIFVITIKFLFIGGWITLVKIK